MGVRVPAREEEYDPGPDDPGNGAGSAGMYDGLWFSAWIETPRGEGARGWDAVVEYEASARRVLELKDGLRPRATGIRDGVLPGGGEAACATRTEVSTNGVLCVRALFVGR
jgi:hypothetical protein